MAQSKLGKSVALLWLGIAGHAAPTPADTRLPLVDITATRSAASYLAAGSVTVIPGREVRAVAPTHASELLDRVPGVWISRGNGQESLPAIRSPVLTGAGACGAFLVLENGLPIRPAGFCNVNQLFEVDFEQAGAVEVVRGPAGALYGANALHGAVNIITPLPQPGRRQVALEVGQYDRYTLRGSVSGALKTHRMRLDAIGTSTNGFRDASGFGQQKLLLTDRSLYRGWQVTNLVSATLLNQETAGFVLGKNAYRHAGQRRDNLNPEAFRDAWSLRASSRWQHAMGQSALLTVTPYWRRSQMRFLQHFLPGQPLERNGQQSYGLLLEAASGEDERPGGLLVNGGAQVERALLGLQETQPRPITSGSAFLIATRPAGTHYDYRVRSDLAAAWYGLRWPVSATWEGLHDLRIERLAYDYRTHAAAGNNRPDGTPCGFGGCLFSRPADRRDSYTNWAGRIGVRWQPAAGQRYHLTFNRAFRPPQANELYRLQRQQRVASLKSVRLRGVELGASFAESGGPRPWSLQTALYFMDKRHVILRDARGFNVSDGHSRHLGLEIEGQWRPVARHRLSLALSLARHRYAFDRAAALGEQIRDGNDVDTAPRVVGDLRWLYQPTTNLWSELELRHLGRYYLDAANTARYPGHTLVNLRGGWQVAPKVSLQGRLTNLFDQDYAERADFAFGNFRYFPGAPRQLSLGITVTSG